MDRYIFVSDAIIDREKVLWIDWPQNDHTRITVHFLGGQQEEWDGENARIIVTAFEPPRDWAGVR